MSKSYKKKINKEDEELEVSSESSLSKKELYDLNKKKKEEERIKHAKKVDKKKKVVHRSSNTFARIFAIFMLVLMIGSVFVTFISYLGR